MYDMRKFTKLAEYKLSSNKVSQIKLSASGLMSIVSDGKIVICKVIDEQLQSLIEFSPKEAIIEQIVEVISNQTTNIDSMEFLMLSRPDMIEHVDVNITQSEITGTVRQFFKVEGTIRDYKLHPSNQYIVVLTDAGFYYIFNLA